MPSGDSRIATGMVAMHEALMHVASSSLTVLARSAAATLRRGGPCVWAVVTAGTALGYSDPFL